jgi:SAM-dependent methyltransferase
MIVDYEHSKDVYSSVGPQAAFPVLLDIAKPSSLLDVGCGTGTWLKAAMECGIEELMGIDGVAIPPDQLLIPDTCFQVRDLTRSWDLGRRFDAVLCLEVAEHLDESHSGTLLDALTRHSDIIIFSAACPGQTGQHHLNCQWPAYWQQLFNHRGYVCSDAVRWRLWEMEAVEPWYKQNMFTARHAPKDAGEEPRIPAVFHPKIMPLFESEMAGKIFSAHVEQIQKGRMPLGWYLDVPFRALWAKLKRKWK